MTLFWGIIAAVCPLPDGRGSGTLSRWGEGVEKAGFEALPLLDFFGYGFGLEELKQVVGATGF